MAKGRIVRKVASLTKRQIEAIIAKHGGGGAKDIPWKKLLIAGGLAAVAYLIWKIKEDGLFGGILKGQDELNDEADELDQEAQVVEEEGGIGSRVRAFRLRRKAARHRRRAIRRA